MRTTGPGHLFVILLALAAAPALAATPSNTAPCALTAKEAALAKLLVRKPDQMRPELRCDPALVALARARATDMATRGYFKHATPEGVGPNDFLRANGFELPPSYPTGKSNTVEAIVGGYSDPADVHDQLLGSSLHRAHVLGEDATFVEQDLFGIGYAREWNSPQVDFWVVLIARRAVPGEAEVLCSPPPSECLANPRFRHELEVRKPKLKAPDTTVKPEETGFDKRR